MVPSSASSPSKPFDEASPGRRCGQGVGAPQHPVIHAQTRFTTAIFAQYGLVGRSDIQLAAFIYSAALGGAGIFFNLMWQHALHSGLINTNADPIFYGVAFLLTFVSPYLSVGTYIILLFCYALPGPSVIRWMTGHRARRSALRPIQMRQNAFRHGSK
jgi:hypothetical protein